MGQDISYNAPGLAILQQANRHLAVDPDLARAGLIVLFSSSSVAVTRDPRFLKTGAAWLGVAVAGGVSPGTSRARSRSRPHRTDAPIASTRTCAAHSRGSTTSRAARRRSTSVSACTRIRTANGCSSSGTARSSACLSLDGTAQGPGPTRTPDANPADGVLSHSPGLSVRGRGDRDRRRGQRGRAPRPRGRRAPRPVAPDQGRPAAATPRVGDRDLPRRLVRADDGVHALLDRGKQGRASARRVSREAWGGIDKPGNVTIKIGPIVIGPDKEPPRRRARRDQEVRHPQQAGEDA